MARAETQDLTEEKAQKLLAEINCKSAVPSPSRQDVSTQIIFCRKIVYPCFFHGGSICPNVLKQKHPPISKI